MEKKKTRKTSKSMKSLLVKTSSATRVKGGFLKKLPGKRTPPTVVLKRGSAISA
jgi:hypothetical protein